MDRTLAVKKYVELKLVELSKYERNEQLSIMLLEEWSEAADWHTLPKDVKDEFKSDKLEHPPESKRYNDVLRIWIKDDLIGVSNVFLIQELSKRGVRVKEIIGEPEKLFACPCCGRKTLQEQASFDICRVCWWEDDGQDNIDADKTFGGANYGITLAQARYNYLTKGIYDPKRSDLFELKEPELKYDVGRVFELKGTDKVYEPAKNIAWKVQPNNKHG